MLFLKENNKKREKYFPIGGKALRLPIYFPSISSLKTGLSPLSYFKVLKALQQPHFLVSAYDIDNSFDKEEFVQLLKENKAKDEAAILMDSGNYESYWTRDKSWSANNFNKILKDELCDLAFCFDNQFPPESISENSNWIFNSTKQSQSITNRASIIPIIHCEREKINDTVLELNKQINFSMVAFPERRLGEGLIEKIKTITQLRKTLNSLENYTYLHVLGTGNPLSLLLYSFAGADSFDGLEWCQTTVNSQTALLYHFQQREIVIDSCKYCTKPLDYTSTTLAHNLAFYNSWMEKIQNAIDKNKEEELLSQYFDSSFVSTLTKIWS